MSTVLFKSKIITIHIANYKLQLIFFLLFFFLRNVLKIVIVRIFTTQYTYCVKFNISPSSDK